MRTSTPERHVPADLLRLIAEGSVVRSMTDEQEADLWRRLARRADMLQRSRMRHALIVAAATAAVTAVLFFVLRAERVPLGQGTGVGLYAGPTAGPSAHATALAGAAAADAELSSQLRTVYLGSRGNLSLWPNARVTLPPGADANHHGAYRVLLEGGRLAATVGPRGPDEPLTVVTPELSVAVVGTRFSVTTSQGISEVAVEEGKVRVEKSQRSVFLTAGDSIRSDDPRLADAQASLAFPCLGEANVAARRACLGQESQGRGIAAENALLALGLLERNEGGNRRGALASFREYQRRFPTGILAPEVALAITSTLALDGDLGKACAEADAFLRRFPHDRGTYDRLRQICSP
jgi:hypothetical protein